jgi:5-formyltetrahydrofolate cyclo-ligase
MTAISTVAAKQAMRAEARERRAQLARVVANAGERMAEHFLRAIPVAADATVSAYWPMGDEADPLPLTERLRLKGHAIALPRIAGAKRTPLAFHVHLPESELVGGKFGLSEPHPDWTVAIPSVVIVPLLAFDARGYRLGYGGGFYDATLADLRRAHDVVAVGYAYAGQEMADVPHDDHDERLDWVVTEQEARRFAPS